MIVRWIPAGLCLLLGCDALPRKVPPREDPIPSGSTCEQALALLAQRCTACHRPEGQTPPLDPGGAAALSASQLALVSRKVSGTQAAGEGLRMPPGVILADAEVAIIDGWIAEGAPSECEPEVGEPQRHHVDGWADPAMHGLGLKLAEQPCRDCHGEDLRGNLGPSCDSCHQAEWRTTCTYCHGGTADETGAPPRDITGALADLTFPAHTSHVSAQNHLPFDCTECHAKPTDVGSLGHVLDGTAARAEVDLTRGRSNEGNYLGDGSCSNLWCHGNGRGANGSWSVARGTPTCNDCHAGPGSEGGLSQPHDKHLEEGLLCAECHGATVDAGGRIVGLAQHVNRQVDIELVPEMTRASERCSGTCHGETHDSVIWSDD